MLAAVSGGRPTHGETPRVSVVMAVFNGERFVREAIESLQAQTLDGYELIVIDDGSTDATPRIVAALAVEDDRIRLHSQTNTGYPEALNVGLRLARGEHVAILDADDLAEPGRLERHLAYLDDHPEVGVVGGSLLLVTVDGRPFYLATYPATAEEVRKALETDCPMGHTATLARRAILEEVGGYRSAIPLAEDYDLWLRISERYPIVNLPDIVGRYRMHGANESHADIRRGAESIVRAQADAAERRGESRAGRARGARGSRVGSRALVGRGLGARRRRLASAGAGRPGGSRASRRDELAIRPRASRASDACAQSSTPSSGTAPRECVAASPRSKPGVFPL